MYKNIKAFLLILISFSVYGQNTLSYSAIESHYNNGIELYGKKAYTSARKEFKTYISLSEKSLNPNHFNLANAEYYSAMSSLYSGAQDADIEIERFVLKNGDHPKAKIIFADLAGSYFERGAYADAIVFYEKSLENREENLDTYQIRYKLGLAYYQQKDNKNALRQFDYVKRTVISEAIDAAYYAAVIHYENGNYDEALADFRKVDNVSTYRKEIPNWIGQILYRQKRYDEFMAYSEPIIANPDGRNYVDLALLAAEISFFKDDFNKAALYYDKFKTLRKSVVSSQVTFRHAFSLYKTERYKDAAAQFKLIANTTDEIGQQAAYYLGISSLRLDDLNSAQAAFDRARKLNHDLNIKEEASYNYVKILVEQGNSQQAVTELQAYVKDYPNGKYVDETNELLSDILFETNNFLSAIKYIEELPRTTSKLDEAYQKLTFSQGVVEFNAEKFQNAILYFDKSLTKRNNSSLNAAAKFWKAEALYQLDDINAAENLYRELQNTSDSQLRLKSQYALGYLNLDRERYTDALRYFQDFRSGARGNTELAEKADDAGLRIGDIQIALKNYTGALSSYDEAFRQNKTGRDYALYQKALVLKFLGRESEAKSALDEFTRNFGNSRLLDDVLFQNGNMAMEAGNYSQAINIFTDILRRKPNSERVPEILLRRGLAFMNIGNYNNSISDFKVILDKYRRSSQASEAFLGIREALSQAGRSEEFFEIAERYKVNNPEGTSVQGLQFDTAKDLFFTEKYDKAIAAFTKFINQYPGSVLIPEANYLIAESYLELKNISEALRYYQEIVLNNQLEFLSQGAMRSANIYLNNKQYDNAIQNFLIVAESTTNQRELVVTYEGLMKSYFEKSDYDRTIEYSDKILETGGNVVVGATNRAELYKGKALMGKNSFDAAIAQFEKTIKLSKDEAGAESKYSIGEILYKEKKYDESIKTMQELANDFSDYLVWYEKAFMLIADNYIAKGDSFMAKATLNSIIENSDSPETVAAAKRKLSSVN